jgi:2-isopropylmalate synthase
LDRIINIFDTTLRDGEQSPGASLNPDEKLEIARQLARLNVDVIEAGFPISSQGDFDAVKAIAKNIKGPVIAGLCRANRKDIDRAWEALQYADRSRIHTFIATSDIHLTHKLKKSHDDVLNMAVDAVSYARKYTDDVEFSAEDASRTDADYLCRVLEAVIDAGATVLNIPDTVGYILPTEFSRLISTIRERVKGIEGVTISVHCHNDLGLAAANALAAVEAGADQVECTLNGIGERAGNTALEEIVMALATRADYFGLETNINTQEIYKSSRMVSDMTGIIVQPNKAIVGVNAFAHEAGIHQHGVMCERSTYEIMDARDIGLNESQLVLGKHSGRHAFEKKLNEMGYALDKDDLNKAFIRFKDLADKKKEVSDRDIESIIADEVYTVPETFTLDYMHVSSGTTTIPEAAIRIIRDGVEIIDTAVGVGSVDAVYKTIDKTIDNIVDFQHKLIDYSVKSVTGGTDALGEVMVRLGNNQGRIFTGRGSSTDIIEASAKAYIQALNKLAYESKSR